LDAVRISDGKLVGLKKVDTALHPFEVEIHKLLTSEPLASDPDNHCVPLYEVLQVPSEKNTVILVMPYLRRYESPRMETIGEAVDFFRQAFKGMQFIHRHGVAHRLFVSFPNSIKILTPSRDGHSGNLMYDGASLYPDGHHPHPLYNNRKPDFTGQAKHFTRTQVPPKYYWIDFGISNKYDLSSTATPSEDRIWGGDRTVPEYVDYKGPCNPFPIDVYYVGNLIKTNFVDVSP
jgi:serine/threonine protein kinase